MGSNADAVDPTPSKAGLWEDFVDIFYAPSSVFARRSNGQVGLAFLFLIVASTILIFVTKNAMQPVMDAEFARQSAAAMRKNPNLTAEQMASGRAFFETIGPIFYAVILAVSVFLTAFVLWLVSKLFDAKASFMAAIMIATYSEFPRIPQILVNAAQALFMSPEKLNGINAVGLSPARFMDPDQASAVAIALAARLDLFTIWVTVLLGIGIYVVGKVTKQQAAIIAVIVWVVGALPSVLGALRGG